MAATRAPKQWSLNKNETITSFEAWKQNLQYTLTLDPNFAIFLIDGSVWTKKSTTNLTRGLTDDNEEVPVASWRTAAQKVAHLELMLGQIANYCPIISRNTIVKHSTSIQSIWQAVRTHFGFQSTGAHFLDFDSIKLEPGERPEDLYQRLNSLIEDNLLQSAGGITHHGDVPESDEELSPSLENIVTLTWLRLIHNDLPSLVKQRYGPELRAKTLASLKPEISQALDSLLDEIRTSNDAKVLRSAFRPRGRAFPASLTPRTQRGNSIPTSKVCPLCKQAGRPRFDHFLSTCKFLPPDDRQFMSRARQSFAVDEIVSDVEDICLESQETCDIDDPIPTSRRVSTKQSPQMKAYYGQHVVCITLDSGSEISMIKAATADYLGISIQPTNQNAFQADGSTPLEIVGETRFDVIRDKTVLHIEALVVRDLDVDILAGIPFMSCNDISIRPARHEIMVGDSYVIRYNAPNKSVQHNRVRRTQAFVLRAPSTTIWPGEHIELGLPEDVPPEEIVAVEPRIDNRASDRLWPKPTIVDVVGGKMRLVNNTNEPQRLKNNDHFCQVLLTKPESEFRSGITEPNSCVATSAKVSHGTKTYDNTYHSDCVKVDPDAILTEDHKQKFRNLLREQDPFFDPNFKGYNGAAGSFEATVNMGPTQTPQRKGRLPQYSQEKQLLLQQKCDELETLGILRKPEDLGITVEYLNPSFLVSKANGGHKLVTAFEDVGRYSKSQPSLMPDVDSTLRRIGQWKYLIVTDLTKAFQQTPLSKMSLKYCGIVTPYKGVCVYTQCAMGMPGSETALEELMCRVLGDQLQAGIVAKLADDLYCGGNTPDELIDNWTIIMKVINSCGLRLSSTKTVICPRSTTILGWVWLQGRLSASPYKVSVLTSCKQPDTVHGLRSFIGAYKVLARVVQSCAQAIAPLENAICGLQSKDKIVWTDELVDYFSTAQARLRNTKEIVIPRRNDRIWIVTDGSVSKSGIGATLYAMRDGILHLAGFYSAKLRKHQVTWLPCEIEALCIAAAIRHFSPFIIQSRYAACVLTDSKPCVQAIQKLRRGEFSASPRVTSFLSTASRYQVDFQHLAGSANLPSDFASRNAADCNDPSCQICNFIIQTEDSVVRNTTSHDLLNNLQSLPFTTRSAWINIQSECPDLRRAHAHLKQGTRPSRKLTNIRDVKRYLNVATISRDGLLVVCRNVPLQSSNELIIVPRSVLDGLITAMHIRFDHPTKHQMLVLMKRNFYALDMSASIDHVCDSCHMCSSLQKFPKAFTDQTSEPPPDAVGVNFAADVIKRSRQLIFVLRDSVTAFTTALIISDEKSETLRDAVLRLCMELHPLDGPHAVVRVDPAPGFISLREDKLLERFRINLEIGRVKNPNKNPVAEKAVAELEDEILRQEPGGGPISPLILSICCGPS